MNIQETMEEMMAEFPTLFQQRWQCLDYLYCVNGGCFVWANGELVDGCRDCHPPRKEPQTEDEKELREYCIEKTKTAKMQFYPVSEYSNLFNMPEDIKPEWREAALETMDLIMKAKKEDYGICPWDMHGHNRKEVRKFKLRELRPEV